MAKRRDRLDGGPAFPVRAYSHANRWEPGSEGMSLRDFFAAKAMAAYVAKEGPASDEDGEFLASYAYEIADKLLVERTKKQKRRP